MTKKLEPCSMAGDVRSHRYDSRLHQVGNSVRSLSRTDGSLCPPTDAGVTGPPENADRWER